MTEIDLETPFLLIMLFIMFICIAITSLGVSLQPDPPTNLEKDLQ